MKKNILILSFILFTISQVFASKENMERHRYYGNGESFNFIEGNVHFVVFQNGEFDFFIEQPNIRVDVNLGHVNITFNSGYNYDNYVLYDDYGAVIQVEDIPIYYDYYGRISRIGSTVIRYQNRRLIQFGGMYVHYRYNGYFDYCSGYVNRYNRYYNYRPYISYFIRPIYIHSVVSYEPYRRYYRPKRYRYNSAEYRRRARTNSYYRTSSKRISRREIPRRTTPKTRTSIRRNTAVASTNNPRRTNSVRNNHTVRRNTHLIENSPRRVSTNRTTGTTIRRKPVTTRNTSVRTRNTSSTSTRRNQGSRSHTVRSSNRRPVNNSTRTIKRSPVSNHTPGTASSRKRVSSSSVRRARR